MKKIAALLFIFLTISVLTIFAQIPVKINVITDDSELQSKIKGQLESKIGTFKGVKITSKNHFTLNVRILKRKVSPDIFDYYFSVLSTAKAACVLGRDSNGSVYSTRSCVEQLTNDSYVGRDENIPEIMKDVINKFDVFVVKPERVVREN